MQRIVALAVADEERAAAQLGQLRSELELAQEKFDELKTYRSEYEGRHGAGTAVSAVRWQDYHAFLSRLDQALIAQQQLAVEAANRVDAERRRWMSKRQRRESLQRVFERYQKDASQAQDRQQQQRLDDLPRAGTQFQVK